MECLNCERIGQVLSFCLAEGKHGTGQRGGWLNSGQVGTLQAVTSREVKNVDDVNKLEWWQVIKMMFKTNWGA